MDSDNETFVVWVHPRPSAGDPDEIRGRVEHVRSSSRERFAGRRELLAFIARHLRTRTASSAPPQPESDGV